MKQIILLFITFTFSGLSFAQSNETVADSTFSAQRNRNPILYNPGSQSVNTGQEYQWTRTITNMVLHSELRKIKNQYSYRNKKQAARQLADTYQLAAAQVSQLCNIFNSYARVDIAKYCYTRCYDPANYNIVLNNMSMDMAEELNDYIAYTEQSYNPSQNGQFPLNTGSNNYYRPMNEQSFTAAKQTISNANFDNTKLETAKAIVAVNYVSADQVAELCRQFDFEATRLDFAKYAYSHTCDKNNYFKVNNVFDFDASRSTLNRFIQQQN